MKIRVFLYGWVATLVAGGNLLAQANFSQSFTNVGDGTASTGGPPGLTGAGWVFRNQSSPNNGISPYWTEYGAGWGQSGPCLGHGAFASWQSSSSKVSAWIILPAIPNQQAGDQLSFWTSKSANAFGDNFAKLEIRYSAGGGTSTGSNQNSVGDFTQLLLNLNQLGGQPWTEHTTTLPGSGRIAFRMVIDPTPTSTNFHGSFFIDSLQIGTPPSPPQPMPGPGQTVHWTTAHSPVTLVRNGAGQNPAIPATATVVVDPGVEVRVASGAQLEILGQMQLAGTAAAPVRMRGPGWFVARPGGLMTAAHADMQVFVDLIYGGKAHFVDSTFVDPSTPTGFSYDRAGDIGHRFFDGNLSYARQILSLERCTFAQGCSVTLLRGWLAARDCTFYRGSQVNVGNDPIGGEAMYVTGNAILDNVTATECYLDIIENHDQHRYIGNVSVTGNPDKPGIRLEGGANYFIDSNVTLQGNKWPVHFGFNSAGILPGSTLPQTGNTLNEIAGTDDPAPLDERVVWADAGIPYAVTEPDTLHGQVTILPGVTVKIGENVPFFFDTDSNGQAMPVFLGEPDRPILFTPYTPGTQWLSLPIGNVKWFGTRWDWCIFEGSQYGVGYHGMPIAFDNCTFRNNHRALYTENLCVPRGCTFENNVFSITGERFAPNHEIRGFLDANHPANPNTFVNNNGTPDPNYYVNSFLPNGGLSARTANNSLEQSFSDVRNNWWGTPTGPFHPQLNPTGEGDTVFFGLQGNGFLFPYLTEPPAINAPPTVRFVTQPQAVIPDETVVFIWTVRDDGSIVSQRVYYSPDSNVDSRMQLLAELPVSARSFEWVPPHIGTPPNGADQFFRVIAVDDGGREGIADLPIKISNPTLFSGTMTPTTPTPGVYRPGDSVPVCATLSGAVGSMYAAFEFDNDETGVSLGGVFQSGNTGCTVLSGQVPDVSTDRARIRYDATASLNQVRSFYGPYFSIRPDPMLGDAAPTITLTSSHDGQSYSGGSIVPIAWAASDDEAIRGFDIRASYDGGTRWFIVARDLPATATSYAWRLPASSGIGDVKLRVVVKDLRFQNSSAESGLFSITPGNPTQPGDVDGNGIVSPDDVNPFIMVLLGVNEDPEQISRSDVNSDGMANGLDVAGLVSALVGG